VYRLPPEYRLGLSFYKRSRKSGATEGIGIVIEGVDEETGAIAP
jgi:hypothetical protein